MSQLCEYCEGRGVKSFHTNRCDKVYYHDKLLKCNCKPAIGRCMACGGTGVRDLESDEDMKELAAILEAL